MKVHKYKKSKIYLYLIITLLLIVGILSIFFYSSINNNSLNVAHKQVIKRLSDEENDKWALKAIGYTDAFNNTKIGFSPKIAVIDTGVNPKNGVTLHKGYNALEKNQNTVDTVGHGTIIAQIISSVYKKPQIIPVKITNSNSLEQNDVHVVENAIVWSVDNGADIINLSFGMEKYNSDIDYAIKYAIKNGISVICSSGNYGDTELLFPARLDGVISVMARNINNIDSTFSNKSTKKCFSAPGVNIVVDGNKYSGTSYATGYVTGIVAIMKSSKKSLGVKEIIDLLIKSSIDGNEFSYGLVRIDRILDEINN